MKSAFNHLRTVVRLQSTIATASKNVRTVKVVNELPALETFDGWKNRKPVDASKHKTSYKKY